jgi:AcrR family transcriptional regulator
VAGDGSVSKRQRRAAATQEQLLVAAREVFEERGYLATTVGAVTERAQTAHGTFYLYFKNKEDVFANVMTGVAGDLLREASAPWAEDPRLGIEAGMRGFLRVFEEHAGLWRCLLEGIFQSPKVRDVWLEVREGFVGRLAEVFRAQQRRGGVRDFDPVLAANAMGAMTEWFAFTHLVMDQPPAGPGAQDRAAELLTDLWYHAIWGVVPGDRDRDSDGTSSEA